MNIRSWISPKTQKAQPSSIHGLGFFAVSHIAKGELVALKAGHIVSGAEVEKQASIIQGSQLQISDDLYLAPLTAEELPESMIYFNHSCEPNLVIDGQIAFRAFRDIQAGEELTVDYGTIYADDFTMECVCGFEICRHLITGNDWKTPQIQEKYGDHFASFILHKIKHFL